MIVGEEKGISKENGSYFPGGPFLLEEVRRTQFHCQITRPYLACQKHFPIELNRIRIENLPFQQSLTLDYLRANQ